MADLEKALKRWSYIEQKHIPTDVLWQMISCVVNYEGLGPEKRSLHTLKREVGFQLLGTTKSHFVGDEYLEKSEEADYIFLIRTKRFENELFYCVGVWAPSENNSVEWFSEYGDSIGSIFGKLEEPNMQTAYMAILDALFTPDVVSEILLETI